MFSVSAAATSSTPEMGRCISETRDLVRQHNRIRRHCFGRASKQDAWGTSRDPSPSSPGSDLSSGRDFEDHPQVANQLPEHQRAIVARVLRVKCELKFPSADEELAGETRMPSVLPSQEAETEQPDSGYNVNKEFQVIANNC
eukprot:5135138-Amphidinium_carterae.1